MRSNHDQLVFKALVALSEAIDRSWDDPIVPTSEMRFILAWLYATGKSNDREVFDAFWQAVQRLNDDGYSSNQARYMRHTTAHTNLCGIARNSGVELTVDIEERLDRAKLKQHRRK